MKKVSIAFSDGYRNLFVKTPNLCPHCGRTMSPAVVSKSDCVNHEFMSSPTFSITYQCSYSECSCFFAVAYETRLGSDTTMINYSYRPPIKVDLPDTIKKISKMFVDIYAQSTIAESEKLYLIAGVGYRKAAEFLIKDYAINQNPDDSEKIKSMPLSQVISQYLTGFPKLQSLAKAIAWIGNDETHYVRKHDDKDLQDLKNFIQSAVHFIVADFDADEALSFISN